MRRTLVLFVRAPALGGGKSRLARDIGVIAALSFERVMLALLWRRLGRDPRWQLRLATTPDYVRLGAGCPHRGAEMVGQGRGDLGLRMRRAIEGCPTGPVVLVGADIPALRPSHIAAAFRLLGGNDLVFGPAADGGFWLVGARHRPLPPGLFGHVRWSSTWALADTLEGLPRGQRIGFVETLEDVDDGEAWRRLAPRRGF